MILRQRLLCTFLLAVLLGLGVVTLTVIANRCAAQEANKPELRYAESLAKERLADLTKHLLTVKRELFVAGLRLSRLEESQRKKGSETIEDKETKQLIEEIAALQVSLQVKQKELAARREKLGESAGDLPKKIVSLRERIAALEQDESQIGKEMDRIQSAVEQAREGSRPAGSTSERRLAKLEEQVHRLNQSMEEVKELLKKGAKQTK